MQSRNYHNFQTRIRSEIRRTKANKREENGMLQDIKQDTNNECRDSKR